MNSSPSLLTVILLLGGILPLAAGPLLAQWAERSKGTKLALDAFLAVSLGGIVILHLWPHAFLVAGGWALAGGLAGLLLPFLLHGSLHSQERKIYPMMVAIAFLGLAIHATLDGVALLSPVLAGAETQISETHDAEAHDAEAHDTSDAEAHDTNDAEAHDTHDAEAHDTHDAEAHDTHDAEAHDAEAHDTIDAEAHDTHDAEAHDTHDAEAHDTHDAEAHDTHDAEAHDTHAAHHVESPEQEEPAASASAPERDHHEAMHHGAKASSPHHHPEGSAALLALAVILHRLPMGIAVWWLAVPILGKRIAVLLLSIIAGATVLGFSIAGRILVDLSMPGIAIFEAVIAGMLLHVVMGHEHDHESHEHDHGSQDRPHEPHGHGHAPSREENPWISAFGALLGIMLVVGLCRVHPMEQKFAQELSFGEAFTALSIYLAPFFLAGAVFEAMVPGIFRAPRVVRTEIAPAAALTALALLGAQWTLLYALGVVWILAVGRYAASRRGADFGVAPQGPSQGLSTRLEQTIHAHGIWGLVGIGIAALLEPILRIEPGSAVPEWMGPGFALAAAALLGVLCNRNSLLGIILAFFLLHMDWTPAAVLCFLLSGAAARVSREAAVPAGPVLISCLGLLPLIWGVQSIPAGAAVDFHGLAEGDGAGRQTAALAVLTLLMTASLFLRGFRDFVRPVFGQEATTLAEEAPSSA